MIADKFRSALSSFKHPEQWLINWAVGGSVSRAGITITDDRALEAPAVLCALRNLSESVAMLPLYVYEITQQNGRRARSKAVNHALYYVLSLEPNPEITAFQLWEWVMNSLLFYGNAYCEIERNNAGEVKHLWPLLSYCMKIERGQLGQIIYTYSLNGNQRTLRPDTVLHFRGFFMGGLLGLSLKDLGKEAIGTNVAADEYAARTFKDGVTAGGVVTHPLPLTKEAKARIGGGVQSQAEGLSNAGRAIVLDEGMGWTSIGINPRDAQMLEARRYGVLEICRVFNIPPHRLYDLENAHQKNIEHQGIEYVTYSILPWNRRIEQQVDKTLLGPEARGKYYSRFLVDALMRGDLKSRNEAYAIGKQWGWLTTDDILEREEMNPTDDESGTVHWAPLNMVNAASLLQVSEPKPIKAAPENGEIRAAKQSIRNKLRTAWKPVFAREMKRLVRGEIREIKKLVKQHLGTRDSVDFIAAVKAYYEDPEQFQAFASGTLGPVMQSYAEAISAAAAEEVGGEQQPLEKFVEKYSETWAARFAETHADELIELAGSPDEDVDALIEERLAAWEENAEAVDAETHSVGLGDAAALVVFRQLGVKKMRWQANANACPLCKSWDGRVVAIDGEFAAPGGKVEAEGVTPIQIHKVIRHAPLHKGCTCMVMPE